MRCALLLLTFMSFGSAYALSEAEPTPSPITTNSEDEIMRLHEAAEKCIEAGGSETVCYAPLVKKSEDLKSSGELCPMMMEPQDESTEPQTI